MHKVDSFERLMQKALQSQDFPPLPASVLKTWQTPRTESAAKWLWILPSMVFVVGIVVGVELAPLGLTNAFSSMKGSLMHAWQSIPEDALKWAFALLLGIVAFSFDSIKRVFR